MGTAFDHGVAGCGEIAVVPKMQGVQRRKVLMLQRVRELVCDRAVEVVGLGIHVEDVGGVVV